MGVLGNEYEYEYVEYNNLIWTLAPSTVSQAHACMKLSLQPTDSTDSVPWSKGIMMDVITLFNKNFTSENDGLVGCCTPTLWCRNDVCFTHSFSSNYYNFAAVQLGDVFTAFTCRKQNFTSTMTISNVAFYERIINIEGDFGTTEQVDVDITVNGNRCGFVNNCNSVCDACTTNSDCEKDGICLRINERYSCLKYCAGSSDMSCPCSSVCRGVAVYYRATDYINVYLCVPTTFDCSTYDINPNVQCESPAAYNLTFHKNQGYNDDSFSISVLANDRVGTAEKTNLVSSCTQNADCFDNNLFTTETCYNGVCTYSYREQNMILESNSDNVPLYFGSIHHRIREKQRTGFYYSFIAENKYESQNLFEKEITQKKQKADVIDHDDYPLQVENLDFETVFYGNRIDRVAISPNGLISLPPIPSCRGSSGDIRCQTYSSGSNVISLFGADWNPKRGGAIWYYEQDLDSSIENRNLQAFHLLYQDVLRYNLSDNSANTFSVSIYSDNSIRFRYHKIETAITTEDVFGLWGSFASQDYRSKVIEHEETIAPAHVKSGTDTYMCYLQTLVGVRNVCLKAGDTLNLVWSQTSKPSCLALQDGYLTFTCVWPMDIETPAVLTSSGSNYQLTCSVPDLNLTDASLIPVNVQFSNIAQSLHSDPSSIENAKMFVFNFFDEEIASSDIMIRYFSPTATSPICGCNPFDTSKQFQLDSCLVCNGVNSTVDCNGDCFGSAYLDSCDRCSGGLSKRIPKLTCFDTDWNNSTLDLISKTILVLTMMVCLTFFISACLRVLRSSWSQQDVLTHNIIFLRANGTGRANSRGLTSFELDSLGTIPYSLALFSNAATKSSQPDMNSSECPICLLEFEVDVMCRQLPCDHLFHKECIDKWFAVSVYCPMCKRNIHSMLVEEESTIPVAMPGTPALEVGRNPLNNVQNMEIGDDSF